MMTLNKTKNTISQENHLTNFEEIQKKRNKTTNFEDKYEKYIQGCKKGLFLGLYPGQYLLFKLMAVFFQENKYHQNKPHL